MEFGGTNRRINEGSEMRQRVSGSRVTPNTGGIRNGGAVSVRRLFSDNSNEGLRLPDRSTSGVSSASNFYGNRSTR